MGIKNSVDRLTDRLSQRVKYVKIGGRNLGDFTTVFITGIIPVVYLLILFFYSGGIVNALLEGTRANLGGQIIIQARAAQSPTEGILNASVLAMGTTGVLLMYRGGRQTMRGRLANSYILGGSVLLLMSVLIGLAFLRIKGF